MGTKRRDLLTKIWLLGMGTFLFGGLTLEMLDKYEQLWWIPASGFVFGCGAGVIDIVSEMFGSST